MTCDGFCGCHGIIPSFDAVKAGITFSHACVQVNERLPEFGPHDAPAPDIRRLRWDDP